MSYDYFTNQNPPLRLDSLPDFMKSKEPQVRFNSAFPPLTTKVRVRSVMERAGFDVYKPGRDISVSSKNPTINDLSQLSTDEFYPPNKFNHSNRSLSSNNSSPSKKHNDLRSFSHNPTSALQSSSSLPIRKPRMLNVTSGNNSTDSFESSLNYPKTRNNNSNNNNKSAPHLLNNSSSSIESPKKKKGILNFAKQKLNIHLPSASSPPKPIISAPISSDSLPIAPNLIAPSIAIPSPHPTESSFNIKKKSIDNHDANNQPTYEFEPTFNNASYNEDYNNYTNYNSYNNNIPEITGEFIQSNTEEEENDPFKSSVQLPNRLSTQLHGPKPYLNSDDESDSSADSIDDQELLFQASDHHGLSVVNDNNDNDFDLVSQKSSILTTGTNHLNTQLTESDGLNPNVLNPEDLEDAEVIRQSVGSFDAKFMLQNASAEEEEEDYYDVHGEEEEDFEHEPELTFNNPVNNISQDSFGGLTGFRNIIKPTDFDDSNGSMQPLVPDVTNPYDQNSNRISTLSTNDMKIYNLQSLGDNDVENESIGFGNHQGYSNVNEMSMIQEGEVEDSRFEHSNRLSDASAYGSGGKILNILNAPNIVIEYDDDNDYNDDVNDNQDLDAANHDELQTYSTEQKHSDNPFNPEVDDGDFIDNKAHSIQQYDDHSDMSYPHAQSQSQDATYNPNIHNGDVEDNVNDDEFQAHLYRRASQEFKNDYGQEYPNDNQYYNDQSIQNNNQNYNNESLRNEDQYYSGQNPPNEYENGYLENNQPYDYQQSGIYDNTVENPNDADLDDNELVRKGFTKRSASTVSTPNRIHERMLPSSAPVPLPNNNDISNIINNIENFDISNNAKNASMTIPKIDVIADTSEFKDGETSTFSIRESDIADHHHHSFASNDQYDSSFTSPEIANFDYEQKHNANGLEHNHVNDIDIDNENDNIGYIPSHKPGEGPCRKCGKDILSTEKKIWSKDNQLSGQWHRSCFGCNTCGVKFNKGSSCYVFNDQPYCESHFHELNGSLCQICNRGVEGECLQNDVNEAFHIDCLKCVICGLNVQGDYFIFRDEVMCEADAKELIYQIEEAEKSYEDDKDVDKIIRRRTRMLYL